MSAKSCSRCAAALPAEARFCLNCGQPVAEATRLDDERQRRLAATAPEALVEKLRSVQLTGERKPVTVLFADIVGSTTLAETMDPEAWAEIVTDALAAMSQPVFHYEGTIAQFSGDGMLAFFGAPIAHEDDPERAVRAALEMVAAIDELGTSLRNSQGIDLRIRAGINTGPVVVGNIGSDLRLEYTAIGDTMNVAARMQATADPGTVRMTAATQRFVTHAFESRDLGPVQVKGKTEPVHAFEVTAVRSQARRPRGVEGLASPLIGRGAELAVLNEALTGLMPGAGRAAIVVGEPGIGKSRLLAEFQSRSVDPAGARWIEARSLSYGRHMPLHVVIELVRSLAGIQPEDDDAAARAALDTFGAAPEEQGDGPALAQLLSLPAEPTHRESLERLAPDALRERYRSAIAARLGALAAQGPAVLILEDVHWADATSVQLLSALLPYLATASLLVILASRPDPKSLGWGLVEATRSAYGERAVDIALEALSDEQSRSLVGHLLEIESLPHQLRDTILARSEGNPFFVEEIVRMLIDRGAIERRGGTWRAVEGIEAVEVPSTLHGLLLGRIDTLPADAKRALKVAAVIGREFPARLLETVIAEAVT